MSQENVEIVRRAFAGWNSGDIEAVLAAFDERVVSGGSRRSPIAVLVVRGEHPGRRVDLAPDQRRAAPLCGAPSPARARARRRGARHAAGLEMSITHPRSLLVPVGCPLPLRSALRVGRDGIEPSTDGL